MCKAIAVSFLTTKTMKIQQYKSNRKINVTAFYHKGFKWKIVLPNDTFIIILPG